MTALGLLQRRLNAARKRRLLSAALLAMPVLGALWVATGMVGNPGPYWIALGLIALIALALGLRWSGALDLRWLARQVDQHCPDLQDSSALLLGLEAAASPLAELQRERLQQAAPSFDLPDLRQPWPWRSLLFISALSLSGVAALAFWPAPVPSAVRAIAHGEAAAAGPIQTALSGELIVQPPGYTGLPKAVLQTFGASVAEASTLRWSLNLQPQPSAVVLQFHDGSELSLHLADDGRWSGERQIVEPTFYRFEIVDGPALAESRSWRIEVVVDKPPQITVLEPERTLTVLDRQQSRWPLRFEVRDDYGLGRANLSITLAQGSGELIEVSERTIRLRGEGDDKSRRYVSDLQLGAYGFARGDDLIVRLSVSDNRQPRAQTARSPSYILRWPAELSAEVGDIDGAVQRVMPTWFRSQRQIIIDTEALVERKESLSSDEFVSESNDIGISQHALRLRYGQFLGEETAEVETNPGAEEEHHANDGHDHPEDFFDSKPIFGDSENVLEEYGHTHDYAEATTLFDPKTRSLLKAALDQMWRAEEQLRLGLAQPALPFEYAALKYIKQAQQAERIYLARVGLELPPIDFSRRLSGDTRDLAKPRDRLAAAELDDPVANAWRKLNAGEAESAPIDAQLLEALDAWVVEQGDRLEDGLDVLALSDELRRDPACSECATRLRQRLWSLLRTPLAAPAPRAAAGEVGRSYLRAIGAGESP